MCRMDNSEHPQTIDEGLAEVRKRMTKAKQRVNQRYDVHSDDTLTQGII